MQRVNKLTASVVALFVLAGMYLPTALAQDNPIPLNWRNLTVQVIETYGNNNTKPLLGAKVKVELKDPDKAEDLLQRYPTLKLPAERTSQTTGARFSQLPPSSQVGPYIVTVIPKPNDINNEYICEERNNRDTREMRMGGGSDQRLTFNFKCRKADSVNEFDRRKAGGYDLTVKVEQDAAPRGYGLWVHLYDKDGNRIKKVRTGGTAEAKYRAINPELSPYKVEVYAINRKLFEDYFDMPPQNFTYTADVDNGGNGGGGGNGASYDLTVKLDLWVHLYDKSGKLVKKTRLDNTDSVKFEKLKNEYNPYKIEVYSWNKLLYSETYNMPQRHSTYSVK